MNKTWVKRGVTVCMAAVLATSALCLPASAAPLTKDAPKGYATAVPGKNDSGVLTYQDFETDKKNDEGLIGKFAATQPDDTNVAPATIELVKNVAHSGSTSLKVSARGQSAAGDPMGYNTVCYKDIGIDIGEKFVKDAANKNKTDTYFISAWVRNVDPTVTQYFWLQLQYGGSGEVWLPGQTYFEVKGDTWTQIGIAVVNGETYYVPFTEDSTKSGIYAPRNGLSTWSSLKFITKNPKQDPTNTNEAIVQTNGDFYVDDIVIWKVDDASKLTPTLPTENTDPTKPTEGSSTTSTTAASGDTTTAAEGSTGTNGGENATSQTAGNTTTTAGNTTTTAGGLGNTDSEPDGLSTGAIVGIVVAAIVVLGGGGFCLYWFVLRKKKA